jgi:hypothetical protein
VTNFFIDNDVDKQSNRLINHSAAPYENHTIITTCTDMWIYMVPVAGRKGWGSGDRILDKLGDYQLLHTSPSAAPWNQSASYNLYRNETVLIYLSTVRGRKITPAGCLFLGLWTQASVMKLQSDSRHNSSNNNTARKLHDDVISSSG